MNPAVSAVPAACCFLAATAGYAMLRSSERVNAPAAPAAARGARRRGVVPLGGLADLLGRPFTPLALAVLGRWRIGIRKRIEAAGRPGDMTLEVYARQTAGFAVLFGFTTTILLLSGVGPPGLLPLLGVGQIELLLYSRVRARREQIERSLPDFLDVLAVTVTAGLSFRLALARVSSSMPGPLADEFQIALRQMELGTPRRAAFEELRRRNRSASLHQFITALLQSEELGAPLSAALEQISADMRRQAAQWAKRKAQRNTPRITAVTTTLSLPAIMILVLGSMLFTVGADVVAVLR
ncbi:type II secretion system F family protein [Actinomadura luteofluorescens]|uniref:type II secretion system F family protein n=1 Tax=Actinomadura luteofluorescens TaxID=46163 RepID=UPI00349A92B1